MRLASNNNTTHTKRARELQDQHILMMSMQRRRSEEMPSTNFSATYTRLSKYLKEQGSLPTTMSLLPEEGAKQAMDLFPQHTGFSSLSEEVESIKAQLTIFYDGQVVVFDDFPSDKAVDLMKMAVGGSGLSINKPSAVVAPAVVADPRPTIDLPIARRASLYRFLEKRKDRVNSIAPYQVSDTSPTKSAVTVDGRQQTWLGFGQQLSMEPALSSEGSS